MKLYILFGQRKESYDGECAPEALIVWDEFSVDENPEGFEKAIAVEKELYGNDFVSLRVIPVSVDGERIERMLRPIAKAIPGLIHDEDEATQ